MEQKVRRIAANYLCFPGYPLVKNGYVELVPGGPVRVVDTGGCLRETAGLEFYGGMLVPGFVRDAAPAFREGEALLPLLERLYAENRPEDRTVALIEGADLRSLAWRASAVISRV